MKSEKQIGISIRSVHKGWGKVHVLKGVSLEVKPGSFTTLLGPSGCGKTTLLRCIAGLEEPEQGEIIIGDKMAFGKNGAVCLPPKARNLGMVFQSYALWPHMTVKENVAFGLLLKKMSAPQVSSRVEEVLAIVGLSGYEGRYPSELSGGQQQRVSLARMLATGPAVLLMDEPLSNLDAKLRNSLRVELKRLHTDIGLTIVYVTHDQIEAMSLSTEVAVMYQGEICDIGPPERVYGDPANLFVSDFMGNPTMNLLKSKLVSEGGELRAGLGDGSLTIAIPRVQAADTGEITLGFRPEDIQVSSQPVQGKGMMRAKVYAVLNTGADLMLTLEAAGCQMTARCPKGTDIGMDDVVYFDIALGNINIFDPVSGRSLTVHA
jgi:multiple sugar transport system ATP-binding protein